MGQFFHLKLKDQRRMFTVFAEHAGDTAILMFWVQGTARASAPIEETRFIMRASIPPNM
jgi:hypothetical protein